MARWNSSSGYLLVCNVTLPWAAKRHQLLQVVVGPDQVADEVDLGGDDVDGGDVDVLPVADDVVVAGAAEHRHTLFGRPTLAHEVQDSFCPVTAGEIQDLLHVGPVGDDAVVGTDLGRQRDCLGITVDDDDRHARDRFEDLDSDVAEATGADHHADVTGAGGAGYLGGRVVGGQARIGQRGHIGGFQ